MDGWMDGWIDYYHGFSAVKPVLQERRGPETVGTDARKRRYLSFLIASFKLMPITKRLSLFL